MADGDSPTTTSSVPNMDDFLKNIPVIGEALSGLHNVISELTTGISGLSKIMSSLGGGNVSLQSFTQNLSSVKKAGDLVSNSILGASKAFEGLNSTGNFSNIKDQFGTTANAAEKMGHILSKILPNSISEAGEYLKFAIENNANAADSFNNLRDNFLLVGAASGTLGESFRDTTINISDLNQSVENHVRSLIAFGAKTGQTTNQTLKHWQLLSTSINDSSDVGIKSVDGVSESISALEATTLVATGTHQNFGEVVNQSKQIFDAFGKEGIQGSLELVSQMASASQNLGIRMQDMQGFVHSSADSFKGLSDKAVNSIEILGEFYNSLRSTGLSSKESVGFVQNLTNQFNNLNLGQKALISAQSGGPGGLLGALRIEKQIRDGDLKGVIDKSKQALLKQFGGNIVTQEEAVKSESAASQFQRQRALLTSGAFGIKTSEDQATRLLEVFKKGGDATKILGKDESLNEVTARGNSLQENTNNILGGIAASVTDIQRLQAERTASQEIAKRTTVGQSTGKFREAYMEFERAFTEDYKKAMTQNKNAKNQGRVEELVGQTDYLKLAGGKLGLALKDFYEKTKSKVESTMEDYKSQHKSQATKLVTFQGSSNKDLNEQAKKELEELKNEIRNQINNSTGNEAQQIGYSQILDGLEKKGAASLLDNIETKEKAEDPKRKQNATKPASSTQRNLSEEQKVQIVLTVLDDRIAAKTNGGNVILESNNAVK